MSGPGDRRPRGIWVRVPGGCVVVLFLFFGGVLALGAVQAVAAVARGDSRMVPVLVFCGVIGGLYLYAAQQMMSSE